MRSARLALFDLSCGAQGTGSDLVLRPPPGAAVAAPRRSSRTRTCRPPSQLEGRPTPLTIIRAICIAYAVVTCTGENMDSAGEYDTAESGSENRSSRSGSRTPPLKRDVHGNERDLSPGPTGPNTPFVMQSIRRDRVTSHVEYVVPMAAPLFPSLHRMDRPDVAPDDGQDPLRRERSADRLMTSEYAPMRSASSTSARPGSAPPGMHAALQRPEFMPSIGQHQRVASNASSHGRVSAGHGTAYSQTVESVPNSSSTAHFGRDGTSSPDRGVYPSLGSSDAPIHGPQLPSGGLDALAMMQGNQAPTSTSLGTSGNTTTASGGARSAVSLLTAAGPNTSSRSSSLPSPSAPPMGAQPSREQQAMHFALSGSPPNSSTSLMTFVGKLGHQQSNPVVSQPVPLQGRTDGVSGRFSQNQQHVVAAGQKN